LAQKNLVPVCQYQLAFLSSTSALLVTGGTGLFLPTA
jgi:hypothetical protein